MNNGQSNRNNKYFHNYNKTNNKRNENIPINPGTQGISHHGKQNLNSRGFSYDKNNSQNNNFQINEKELKHKYESGSLNFNSDVSESNSTVNESNEIYNDKKLNEVFKENKQLKKILKDKEKEIEKLRKDNEKLKYDLDILNKLNKVILDNKCSVSKSSEGGYIFNSDNNENNNNKIDDIGRREKKLKEREKELREREEEFNKKMNFLEDKENQIEKEKNELMKLKQNQKYEEMNLSGQNSVQSSINESQSVKIKPLDSYKAPTLIGLNNIGAQHIMNSTLQCLSQTKQLTNYFLNEKNKEKIINNNIAINKKNDFQLSPVYLDLIQHLWDKNGPKSYSPNSIKNIIEQMNPSFKEGQVVNPKNFIDFILMKLHQELYKTKNIEQNIGPLDPYNQKSSLMHSVNDFQRQGSIITDCFTGFNEETNECLNCKQIFNSRGQNNPIRYSYKIFNCLLFPLEEVKKMKNNTLKSQNININNNRVSLYECFFYNQNSFICKREKNKICQICKQISDSMLTTKIFTSPNILILILDRGKGNIYDVKLDFSESIDITKFVIQKEVPEIKYNLYGVISQVGKSGSNEHYIASCKNPIDNKWYRYNHNFVVPISNIQKEIIEYGDSFVLFYEKLQ